MTRVFETATIESAFDMAKQEVYELAESMRGSAESMPEQLNGAHAEAADKLEIALAFLNNCDIPTDLREEEVTWVEWRGKLYRPQRRYNVVNFLRAYFARVPQNDDTNKLRADLELAIEVLEAIFFPGMSGRRAA